jgi:hypothetical protein
LVSALLPCYFAAFLLCCFSALLPCCFSALLPFYGFNKNLLWFSRYKHPKPECYHRSEKLVKILSAALQHDFGHIFDHLYKIRETEGVSPNEGCMGQSPFTGISITRDYHCNVHSDINDFSYSFFVWLGADGKSTVDFCYFYYLCFLLFTYFY